MRKLFLPLFMLFLFAGGLFFQTGPLGPESAFGAGVSLSLPAPDKTGGKPLMQALADRRSTRGTSPQALDDQTVSNLLWAAWGVNRNDGKRTVPIARNQPNVHIYAAMQSGVWRYEPLEHKLVQVLDLDARARFGNAPLTLLYTGPEDNFIRFHIGSIYQNVALYCASALLADLIKGSDIAALKDELTLPEGHKVFLVHLIGRFAR